MTIPANISDNICQTILIRITLLQYTQLQIRRYQTVTAWTAYAFCYNRKHITYLPYYLLSERCENSVQ